MQFLLEWFRDQANLLTLLQLILDLSLAVLVIVLLMRKPKGLDLSAHTELTTSLENIIHETRQLAAEFEANLQERHKLIQQITTQLDGRIKEANSVCSQLETLRQSAEQVVRQEPAKKNTDHQEVLRLARKGLSIDAVARHLKKPVGEVELILKLNKLSSS